MWLLLARILSAAALAGVVICGPALASATPGAGRSAPGLPTITRSASGLRVVGLPVVGPLVDVGPTTQERSRGEYRWPLDGQPQVVRRFDLPDTPYGRGHRGVDLAAAPGATVRSAGTGVVAYAGSVAGRGVVSVDHANGLRTTYEPVTPRVRAGQVVTAGAPLGVLGTGHPGCLVAACLHWGLRDGKVYLDPLSLLGLGRVRLLPLDGGDRGRAASRSP
jgi:murein DD-endopeptidase MepM/ murein hydrolase activator NlpD